MNRMERLLLSSLIKFYWVNVFIRFYHCCKVFPHYLFKTSKYMLSQIGVRHVNVSHCLNSRRLQGWVSCRGSGEIVFFPIPVCILASCNSWFLALPPSSKPAVWHFHLSPLLLLHEHCGYLSPTWMILAHLHLTLPISNSVPPASLTCPDIGISDSMPWGWGYGHV